MPDSGSDGPGAASAEHGPEQQEQEHGPDHLGPLDPDGQQRCANWSDCRDARTVAEACLAQERAFPPAEDAEPADEEKFELLAAW